MRRREATPARADDAFDECFYSAHHRDLPQHASPDDLRRHYLVTGRAEGRAPNAAVLHQRLAAFQQRHAPLPPDFAWRDYLENYRDLDGFHSFLQAAEHYLAHGRVEGRLVQRFDAELYRSLYWPGSTAPDEAMVEDWRRVGRVAGRVATYADLVRRHGLRGTNWLRRLDLAFFTLLNGHWAGPLPHKGAVVDAMVREGFGRGAPLGFDLPFDPAYYRDANPGLAPLNEAALYRHWVDEGQDGGRPGSAADHLARHGLRLTTYPPGFDAEQYRRRPGVFGDSRWALLDHLVANNAIAAADIPVRGENAGAFLTALAVTIADRVAERGNGLFSAAHAFGPLPADAQQRWARLALQQNRAAEAFGRVRPLLDRDGATLDTTALAVEAALAAGDPEAALSSLARTRERVGGTPRFRALLATTLDAVFAQAREAAERLLLAGRTAEANDLLAETVRRIDAAWRDLDPVGIVIPAEPTPRVVTLANVDLPQCTHYRVEQKAELFAAAGIPFAWFPAEDVDAFLTALPGASAAWFYRLPATPAVVRAIGTARALGIPTRYDIDDLIFDARHYPEPIDTYDETVTPAFHARLALGVPLFRAAMALCDTGLAPTTALAARMAEVVREGSAAVLPNGLDSRNRRWLDTPPARVRRDDNVVLFYGSGTKAHNSDFLDLAGDALLAVMAAHPRLRLRIAGHLSLDARFDPWRDRIVQLGWLDLADYWSVLAESDVVIAPLASSPTTDGKSEIKWLEAAALGLPCIVGDTHRAREVLEHGVDAMLASSATEWRDALDALVTQPGLRRAMADAARRKALARYDLPAGAEQLREILGGPGRGLPAKPRKRLLLVNIFFPPQTVGGSTRVVRDNLDAFLGMPFADTCEFAVATTDNDHPGPHALRVDDYRGCPVFRIGVPASPLMEWRPFDPAAGALFGQVLDLWRPDLVHVHSIQRLTASALVECWRRGIPYINTIHDAWWVSDHHFLVDARGRLREPGEALPLDPPAPRRLARRSTGGGTCVPCSTIQPRSCACRRPSRPSTTGRATRAPAAFPTGCRRWSQPPGSLRRTAVSASRRSVARRIIKATTSSRRR